ncbi:MAG: arylesterase [Flavobacteriales bacterium]|nr:arylesterase [Flavobacteriales bacterium]
MRTLLMFCYIFLSVFCFSCGEKTTENKQNTIENSNTDIPSENKTDSKTILFFGTSLTAGYGLSEEEAYPALIQKKIDSLNLSYQTINAGLSGETTASGKNRINWLLNQKIDIFVLELGANDGLRGVPLEETRKNLQVIIDTVKQKNPGIKILIAGMQIPPNMGVQYTAQFKNIFPELAVKNSAILIPFLLENVGGISSLNQSDGIHPTAEGQKILAENVWMVLQSAIEE